MNDREQLEKLQDENIQLKALLLKFEEQKKVKENLNKTALKWSWKLFVGKSLDDSIHDFFKEFHDGEKISPTTSANLLGSIIKRFVKVRMFSAFLFLCSLVPALVSMVILIKQNSLIDTQNSLVEASRKSSYGFQLSSIFDAVDRSGGAINSNLMGRIIGLSHSLKPYRILENNGELSERMYSPERTQLLLFLLNAGISKQTLSKIYDSADFSNCDLRNANLSKKYLAGINLSNSNLEHAELHSSNLNESNLTGVNLDDIYLSNGTMEDAVVKDASFDNAKIKRTHLKGTDFEQALSTDGLIIKMK